MIKGEEAYVVEALEGGGEEHVFDFFLKDGRCANAAKIGRGDCNGWRPGRVGRRSDAATTRNVFR